VGINFIYNSVSASEAYLSEIDYAVGQGLTANCKINFITENTNYTVVDYGNGAQRVINKRLKEIDLSANSNIQTRYVLGYTTNGVTGRTLLSSIDEIGKDNSVIHQAQFLYQQPASPAPLRGAATVFSNPSAPIINSQNYNTGAAFPQDDHIDYKIMDVTGDGKPDLIVCQYMESIGTTFKSQWLVYRGTANGFSTTPEVWLGKESSYFHDTHANIYEPITVNCNATLIDMNGDGLPDLVYSQYGGVVNGGSAYDIMVRYNTGNGFSTTPVKLIGYSDIPGPFCGGVSASFNYYGLKIGQSAFFADFNGDGKPDLLYYRFHSFPWKQNPNGAPTVIYMNSVDWVVRLNTGSGFSSTENIWLTYDKAYFDSNSTIGYNSTTMSPIPSVSSIVSDKIETIQLGCNATLADMNGDGLLDLVYNEKANLNMYDKTNPNYNSPADLYAYSFPTYSWKVRYNTGTKFSDTPVTLLADGGFSDWKVFIQNVLYNSNFSKAWYDFYLSRVRIGENGILADVNGDGLLDLVYNVYDEVPGTIVNGSTTTYCPHASWWVRYNTGNGFSATPQKISDNLGHIYTFGGTQSYHQVTTENSLLSDINGDGQADLVYPYFLQSISGYTPRAFVSFNLTTNTNLNITPADLLTRVTNSYGGKLQMTYAPSSNFSNQNLSFIMPLLKTVNIDAGLGTSGTTTYNYVGGLYDFQNREFKGFSQVTQTDPLSYVDNFYFDQNEAKLGKLDKEQNTVKTTQYTYYDSTTVPYVTPLKQIDETTDAQTKRTSFVYDNYGNQTQEIDYGDINVTGDEKTILTDYAINSSIWLVNLPARRRIFSGLDTTVAPSSDTLYCYDNSANNTGIPTIGNLTMIQRFLNTINGYITAATNTYDSYGNLLSQTDADNNMTTIAYDTAYFTFPVAITNAKNQVITQIYYQPGDTLGLFGQLASKTDPNGAQITFQYDGFGRLTRTTGPYDQLSTYGSQSIEYSLSGPGYNYILTRFTENHGAGDNVINVDTLDGFGRTIQSAKESEDPQQFSYTTTNYDPRGQISKASLPYLLTGGLKTSYQTPASGVLWSNYTYDILGRVAKVIKPDTTFSTNAYVGWATTVTDENNHPKTIINDAYGRLIKVQEKNAGATYTTNYTYDALDDLIKIVDNENNTTTYAYDTLARRVAMSDPDLGAWSYGYDNVGNLISQSDARGNTISFTYDVLNRMIKKDYGGGQAITYNYDEPTAINGIGRRTSMVDLSGASSWDYDLEGHVVRRITTIDGNPYGLLWQYNALGMVTSITYPNGKQVTMGYNIAGLLNSVGSYCTATHYNPSQQLNEVDFGNGLRTLYTYYPQNLRLQNIVTGGLQNFTYAYDNVGNVASIVDSILGKTKSYTYDDLNRLLTGAGIAYGYSTIGNLISENGVAATYTAGHAHALSGLGGNSYAYDANGNMMSGNSRTIGYNADNLPLAIRKNGAITTFAYDGDGKRVKKSVTQNGKTTTTVYIENLYEKDITQ